MGEGGESGAAGDGGKKETRMEKKSTCASLGEIEKNCGHQLCRGLGRVGIPCRNLFPLKKDVPQVRQAPSV